MMRFDTVSIKNFKSLYDATLEFPVNSPALFLVGLNAAGKSTILQAFDFIGEIMRGDIERWLLKRNWEPSELTTRIHSSRRRLLIEINITGTVLEAKYDWYASFNPMKNFLKCTNESLHVNGKKILGVEDGKYLTDNNAEFRNIDFDYTGSILSRLQSKIFKHQKYVESIKNYISSMHSFDMLSPRDIKRRSRPSQNIGMSGESLAGFLSQLDIGKKYDVAEYLQHFYPWATGFDIKAFRSGWKELQVREKIGKYPHPETGKLTEYFFRRPANHVNDGTLRFLAILSSLLCEDGSVILFDEIENGFNPHIIKDIVNLFFEFSGKNQIVATTHSPEVLQYIPEDSIMDSIKFVFRKDDGSTGIKDFFSSKEAKDKLNMLGAGEVYLDMDLNALEQEFRKESQNKE
jgi:predicted ATPase